jgi:uncharacterized protein (UPF0147 family)
VADENKSKSLKELISDDDTEACLRTIREIRDDTAAPRSLRLQAAEQLLDRKHGKPKQFVEQQLAIATYQDLLNNIGAKESRWVEVTGSQPVSQEPHIIEVTAQPVISLEDLF